MEEDQIRVNFPPGFPAHNNDFIWSKLLKSATLKYALCLFQCQVEVDASWNDGMVGVDVFESQRYVFKMSLECSSELKNLTSKAASSLFEHILESLTTYFLGEVAISQRDDEI